MASGRPLFPGSTVEEELSLITRLLGPLEGQADQGGGDERKSNFKLAVIEALLTRAPRLHHDGVTLLASFLPVR